MQRLSAPIDVQIELTESCNFKCRHCYNFWRYGSANTTPELNIAQFLIILEKLKDHGVGVITLTGGEPFLRSEILFALLKQAKSYGMEVGLNSNASLITEIHARQLKEEGLDHALCSVLGIEKTHNYITGAKDGFSHTLKGVENLVNAGICVAVNMVVSKLNQGELNEVGRIMSGFGINTFCATPMVPSHDSNKVFALTGHECKQALRTLLQMRESYGFNIDTLEPVARCLFEENDEDDFMYFFGNRICSASVTSCAISSYGRVRPCIHSDKEFGDLIQEDLSSIWSKMSFWSDEKILPAECRECEATAICEGGCRMSAKSIHGCYDGKDMYMTAPILDKRRAGKFLPSKNQEPELSDSDSFEVNPLVNFREESFGGIAYSGNTVEFCTKEGFLLLQNLKVKGVFDPAGVAAEAEVCIEDAMQVLLRLLARKVILRKGGSSHEP